MPKLTKNIWLLFYFVVVIGGLLLAAAIYIKAQTLQKEAYSEQLYVSKTFNNHLTSIFNEYETILDLISNEFIQHNKIGIKLLDNVINRNPLLVGFAVFSADGNVQTATSNLTAVNYPNLLNNPHAKQWFQRTLNSERMLIGKSYFFPPVQKWIIPVRKRIMDNRSRVIGVLSAAIDLNALSQQWNATEGLGNTLQAVLDESFFCILRTEVNEDSYGAYYNAPLATPILKALHSTLQTSDELRHSAAYLQMHNKIAEQTTLSTLNYNSKYHLWVFASQTDKQIRQQLYNFSWLCLAFYLLLIMLFFMLCKWVIGLEKSKIAELTYKAEHDALTGLPNRTLLNKQFYKLQSENRAFALLYLDLDNFKNINDTFSHNDGDQILIAVAKRIHKSLAKNKGVAARYSGDEFIIFLQSDNKEEIAEYATSLLETIALPYTINNNNFKISSSVGIARFPHDARHIETLLSYADNSMSVAKKKKDQHLFFSQEEHHQLMRNTEIEQALHRAIMHDEISLVYQPQLDREEKLFGVEALVRWNNDKLGFIAPDIFIPIAEEAGLMPQLGLYIMHRAMRDIALLQKQEQLAFKLSINVSVRQFMQSDFIEKLQHACAFHAMDKANITIEITESLFIESLESLLPLFHALKEQEISLSLDDFGTGYSSLNMLREVPIDELKIDKSFIDHISEKQTDREMIKNIISMGKNLGISVLAEGVETQAHLEILKDADCDLFQGYYFSKPLALADLAVFAKEHKKTEAKQRLLLQAG